MRTSLLAWEGRKYLRWALLLGVVSILLFGSQVGGGAQPPNGGTWQGYVLGTIGALLIVWLSMLGVRKRRYASTLGTVQGWTSAHVYLGSILLLVATLHCAAQFGWNVHTLAYVLMCVVVVSGFYGLYAYMHLPSRVAENNGGRAREVWLAELADLDTAIHDLAEGSDAELQGITISALDMTRLGGSTWQQLSARDYSLVQLPGGGRPVANPEQAVVIDHLSRRIPKAQKTSEAELLNELLALFGRRQVILHRLRRDVRLQGLLKVWLLLHIPLTVALMVALLIHIIAVFIYW